MGSRGFLSDRLRPARRAAAFVAAAAFSLALTSCFSVKATSGEAKSPGNVQSVSIASIHPWAKKRVAYFGDSVTDPAVMAAKTKYWEYLRDWLGIEPYVYAVNGRQWDDVPRQTDALAREHGQDVDAILVFMGTNDFNASVPIGNFWTEAPGKVVAAAGQPKSETTRTHRTLAMDGSTLCGRINMALSKIKTEYPTKQVVLLTPIHRAYAEFGESNVQPDENWQNAAGIWFDEYVETVRNAGKVWSVPVVDMNALSGLYPVLDSNTRFFNNAATDRLHPNSEGHRRMAATLLWQLMSLPCTF
jgi:lysophospholipase L1-like esterase